MNIQPATPQMGPHPAMLDAVRIGWKWMMTLGIVLIIAGGVAIATPGITSVTMELFVGIMFLVGAAVHAIRMFSWNGWGEFILRLGLAVIYLAAGLMLLAYPLEGTVTLTLLIGIFFFAQGAVKIVVSLAQMNSIPNWGWLLFDGVVALILGGLIWAAWPSSSAWVIGTLVGIYLLVDGLGVVMLSWMMRSEKSLTS